MDHANLSFDEALGYLQWEDYISLPICSYGYLASPIEYLLHLSASHSLTTNRLDKMYHQLVEIHATAAAQLAECAH
jgi:hypothetical protein